MMVPDYISRFDSEILQLRDEILSLAAQISAKYSCQKVSEKTVIDLLMEYVCERCILEKLRLGIEDEDEIDRVWRNLHSYSVALLIERLKNKLVEGGFQVSIINEAENPTGRYDILLIVNRRGIQIMNGKESICLEAKTGLNISFNQLEKYLWNGTTIILVRFATGDVLTFRAGEWTRFLKAALSDRIEKARRIIEGRVVLVPAPDCRKCPLKDCRFNESRMEENELGKNNSFLEALEGFRKNAITAIEAAVNSALEELRKVTTQMREDKEEQPPAN
jgi:hypothetical protein